MVVGSEITATQRKTENRLLAIVLSALVALCLFAMYLFYCKNGDIGKIYLSGYKDETMTEDLYDNIKDLYKSPEQIVERLNQLVLCHKHVVKRPHYVFASVAVSFFLLLFVGAFSWLNMSIAVFLICFGFLTADYWYRDHIYEARKQEASFLQRRYRELVNSKTAEGSLEEPDIVSLAGFDNFDDIRDPTSDFTREISKVAELEDLELNGFKTEIPSFDDSDDGSDDVMGSSDGSGNESISDGSSGDESISEGSSGEESISDGSSGDESEERSNAEVSEDFVSSEE